MKRVVLDASAVLAMFFDEPGGDRVLKVIDRAVCCAPIVTEIVTRLINMGRSESEAESDFRLSGIPVEPLDMNLAIKAGQLRAVTRERGLSLGDRSCLALAMRDGARVMTADRPWQGLDLGVEIELIR